MKAILLAGGQGTRLKAVTGDLPKPLVPLLGRPLAEHILRLLRKHGVTQVCAAVRYRPEDVMKTLGDGNRLGMRITYRIEERELGTAGAVKNCGDFIGDEDVLVISGDAACDLDLSELVRRHREKGAAVTLALHRDASPLRFGLAVTDGDGAVRAFVEKPSWNRVVTDLVNTGIYILSPRAMEAIPEGQAFDFGKDLFPLLLKRGELLLGVPLEGYWCDVGTPLSYYRCCVDALEGRLQLEAGEAFQVKAEAEKREAPEPGYVLPYADSPLDDERVGETFYLSILDRADRYVHIMTPYLILDDEMITALSNAAKRGVDVQIILPHIPDKRYAFALAKGHYRTLLEAGVRIYEYTPGFVHAKVFVSDDLKAVVGTINLDYRSLYLHFENAVYLHGVPAVADAEADFAATRALCQEITHDDWKTNPLVTRISAMLLKLFAPLM